VPDLLLIYHKYINPTWRRMTGVAVGIIRGIAQYYHESDVVEVTRLTAVDEERVQIRVDFLS
jgi:hypothetical protein